MEERKATSDILGEKIKEHSSLMHTLRHDLRNYIAAIEGYSYLLKEEYNQDYLTRIFNNINNINEIIDRSVSLADSELEIEKETEINLNLLVKSCTEIVPETVSLQIEALPIVLGDYARILQVFKSVIHNAIIHGKPHKIAITCKTGTNGEKLIQICNDGIKMPVEKASKLFVQLPQSLKPNSGVSLLIAKKVLQSHNWDISFFNGDNQTCFEIKIPKESLKG